MVGGGALREQEEQRSVGALLHQTLQHPQQGLRFFTVYGPAGRPDMAYFGFTNKLLAGKTIQIYNYGNCRRDFTFVDDIVCDGGCARAQDR